MTGNIPGLGLPDHNISQKKTENIKTDKVATAPSSAQIKQQPEKDIFAKVKPVRSVDLNLQPSRFLDVERNYESRTGNQVTNSYNNSAGLRKDYRLMKFLADYTDLKNPPEDMKEFVTGHEETLATSIADDHNRTGQKLEPDDIYRLSLDLNEGDRHKAMLTAQNTIRMLGRPEVSGMTDQDVKNIIGEQFYNDTSTAIEQKSGKKFTPAGQIGEAYLKEHLAPIGKENDYTGKYYHLFGTATANTGGLISRAAPYGHAVIVDAARGVDQGQKYADDFRTKHNIEKDSLLGKATGFAGSVGGAVYGFFDGAYSGEFAGQRELDYLLCGIAGGKERKDKWASDIAGSTISNHIALMNNTNFLQLKKP